MSEFIPDYRLEDDREIDNKIYCFECESVIKTNDSHLCARGEFYCSRECLYKFYQVEEIN